MNKKVQLINELIVKSVIHGGDAGGPYFSDEQSVIKTMQEMKKEFDFLNDYEIEVVDVSNKEYYTDDMPQFIEVWK